ncbi:MAG: hypothetical protein OXF86_01265 [Caldilineaceae bacterium]|nr:hypothetical protein [Caldilineaceae bacterium]
MLQTTRSLNLRDTLVPCLLALLLALIMIVALPAIASAQDVGPGPPPNIPPPPPELGNPGGPGGDPNGGNGNGDNMMGGGMKAPIPKSNRIVLHAATPVQLIKTGDDGLHLYFIGADGSTYTGPTFSSFAMLEEMHPSGAGVSLFDGKNPSTGQPVTVDYLPDENRIFVKTFYPPGHDKYNPNKAYDFTVDDDYKVKHVNW